MSSEKEFVPGKHVSAELRPETPAPPPEREPPARTVQSVFQTDRIKPPGTLLHSSGHTLGTDPIPVSRYLSREFHDAEMEKMWPRVWQVACWTYDIPNPGDVSVYRIGDRSVLVVRQRDGSLKAFVNSCLHRAREICAQSASVPELKCPYHGFTWSLDGKLKWVPCKWDFPQVREDRFKLPQVRLEEWNGFAFINFDPDAPPLKTYLGGLPEQWKDWDFTRRYKAVHVEKQIQCNWKACMDGFIETLHAYVAHPETAPFAADACAQYDVYPDEPHFSRFHALVGFPSPHVTPEPSDQDVVHAMVASFYPELRGTPEVEVAPGETARESLARISRKAYEQRLGVDLSGAPESEIVDGTEYFIFPNFMPWPSIANPIVYRFRPGETPDWCIWETMIFLPFEGQRPPSAQVVHLGPDEPFSMVPELGYLAPILDQDAEMLPPVQRGMKATTKGFITLARYQEVRIRHYHQTIDRYLGR